MREPSGESGDSSTHGQLSKAKGWENTPPLSQKKKRTGRWGELYTMNQQVYIDNPWHEPRDATPEERSRFRALYRAGHSLAYISRAMGRDAHALLKLLKREGEL